MNLYKTGISFVLTALVIIISCGRKSNFETANLTESVDSVFIDSIPVYNGNTLFGIPVDSYNIVNGRVRNNQFISSILASYGVPRNTIDQLLRDNIQIFDPRKVRKAVAIQYFFQKTP